MQYYLEGNNMLTFKEVQDWAQENDFDKNKVKNFNQQLVNDGFLKEKKKPTQFFYVCLQGDALKQKVTVLMQQAQSLEAAKKKKIRNRLEVLKQE